MQLSFGYVNVVWSNKYECSFEYSIFILSVLQPYFRYCFLHQFCNFQSSKSQSQYSYLVRNFVPDDVNTCVSKISSEETQDDSLCPIWQPLLYYVRGRVFLEKLNWSSLSSVNFKIWLYRRVSSCDYLVCSVIYFPLYVNAYVQ